HGAAGWSSPVARQAHNLKVVGSNPTPATTITPSGPPLRLHLELDNKRRMIARLHPPTWNPINPRHNQTVPCSCVEQRVIDAQACVPLEGAAPVLPEGVDRLVWMEMADGVGPAGVE